MTGVLVVFILSLSICCAIAYFLGLFWFSDMRNRRFKSFFILGIQVFIWTLFNAISMVSDYSYFPIIYSIRMSMVCIIPFGVSWFILDFIRSPLIAKPAVRILLFVVPTIDVLCMLTNPLHYLYFTHYDFPIPARALLFWIHICIDFLVIIVVFILLIRYIIQGTKSNPLLIFTGIGLLIPYSINMMYTFGVIKFPHDTTPIGFFFTLLLFMFVSYKLQLFNIKSSLFSSTMDSIGDLIILFNKNHVVTDVNKNAFKAFGDFDFNLGRTKIETYLHYLEKIIMEKEAANIVNKLGGIENTKGEFTLKLCKGEIRSYTFSWDTVYERNKKTGYILMMFDISNYREMIKEINTQKEKAETASKAKSAFLSRMSHEMRTPMNAVIGMTQVAINQVAINNDNDMSSRDIYHALMKIKAAAEHLRGVINDALNMSMDLGTSDDQIDLPADTEDNALNIENAFGGLHILLADDVEINREVIMALFEGSGAIFETAQDGQQAYDMYVQNPECYHMIFMDLQMPKLDGLAATAAIRRTDFKNSKTIPIIAISANAFKEDIDACMEAGMNEHISKPVDLENMMKVVRKYYRR